MAPYSLYSALLYTRALWHPIPYIVHYFRPEPYGAPYSLCSALLLARTHRALVKSSALYREEGAIGLWFKVVHDIGNRVPFGVHITVENTISIFILNFTLSYSVQSNRTVRGTCISPSNSMSNRTVGRTCI